MKAKVAIIMGSHSDWTIMEAASKALNEFHIAYHVEVISAHRTPEKMLSFAKGAKRRGFQIIIAGAGGAAHLPGMVAAATTLPVIGVPVQLQRLNGLDSLLSVVQMPKGVPVATMAVDNAYNAGLLAARIMAIHSPTVHRQLTKYQSAMKTNVRKMNRELKNKIRQDL